MSFHRHYNTNTFQNMNRQQPQTQDTLHNLVTNTNNIINIQSQIITNLNSNVFNLTRMVYNLENQIVNIQSTLNNHYINRNRSEVETRTQTQTPLIPQELPSFNRVPDIPTSTASNINLPNNTNIPSNNTSNTTIPLNTNSTSIPSNNTSIPSNLSNIQSNVRYLPQRASPTSSTLFDNILDDIFFGSNPPSRRTVRPRRFPEIMEVTYSVDNRPSRRLVDLFRTINNEQSSDNLITTHETIRRNTEVYTYSNENNDIIDNENNDINDNENNNLENSNNENYTLDRESNVETCVICQEPLEEGCIMRKIKKCNHSFHMHCLDIWLERKITCPTCRADIRENNDSEDPTESNNEDNLESQQEQETTLQSRTI